MRQALGRPGNVLITVLAVLLAAGIVGMAIVSLSSKSIKTGAWGRDHLALRLLAESAAEEMFLRLEEAASSAGDPLFAALCRIPKDSSAVLPLDGLRATALEGELPAEEKSLGAHLTLACSATMEKLVHLSDDPLERAGVVRLEVSAQLGRKPLATTERVRVQRVFRIARIVPPTPLDQVGFFLAMPARGALKRFPPNTPAFAAVSGRPRSLMELVTLPPPDGLQAISPAAKQRIVSAIGELAPGALARRAQYVTRSAAELDAFLSSRLRAQSPVNGVVHNLSREELQIAFPAFQGKCVLSLSGPVRIGEIRLKDPSRDCLTIVSAGRMVVNGKTVQAVLANFNDTRDGILFEQRSEIYGGLLCGIFPGGLGLAGNSLGDSRLEHDPWLDSGGASASQPDAQFLSHYCIAFAPHPASVEHARDREDWSNW